MSHARHRAPGSSYTRYYDPSAPAVPPAYLVTALLLASLLLIGALARRILRSFSMQGIGLLALERSRKLKYANGNVESYGVGKGKAELGELDDGLNDEDLDGTSYVYPGLLNTSTTCYLNATLQSLASSPSFIAYLRAILDSTDTHLEFTQVLYNLLKMLNTPSKRSSILRTTDLVHSLMNSSSSSNASRNRKRIMQGSGQQDAQEFFLILTDTIEEEKKVLFANLAKRKNEKVGFQELLMPLELLRSLTRIGSDESLKNPFQATMAHRTSCINCGYAEAIRHLPTEHLTLNVPSTRSCRLEAILADHTKLELIDEFACRRCSVLATHRRLEEQLKLQKQDSSTSTESKSISKKKRLRELQKTASKLGEVIDMEDYERDMSDILSSRLDRAIGPATKQTMYSSPPNLLVIHLSRSSFFESGYGYSQKNNCQVVFPEYLSMDPYTTSATLNMNPNQPISMRAATNPEKTAASQNTYRISSLVVHFGSHSSGHYVSFRRRPSSNSKKTLSEDWFRISDDNVELSSAAEMLGSNPFLLFYERIGAGQVSKGLEKDAKVLERWELLNGTASCNMST